MADLKAAQRNKLPDSAFVYKKERKYPIHDLPHARAALALAKKSKTFGEYATVLAAVKKKYGDKIKTAASPFAKKG